MTRKKPKRLPKKFARRASPETKRFVKRTMDRKKKRSQEKRKRFLRRADSVWKGMRASFVRWMLAIAIVIGCIVLGFLLFSPVVQVREIEVLRESPRLDIERVQQALAPMFGKHLFFLSSFEVAGLLEDRIPDLHSVSTGKTYPSTLHVRIELQPLVARLRITEPGQEYVNASGATVDFLTDHGIYIATTSAKDIETLPEITIVDWGVRPDPGSDLIDPLMLERMNAAELTMLRQFGQEISKRIVFLRAQEFHLATGDIELWFDLRSPLKEQIERYRLFLREVSLDAVNQYIDLRIDGRVVYR